MSESTGLPENRPGAAGQLQFGFALLLVLLPHIVLLLLTLGSGWSFPRLLPDRMDFGPWRDLAILSDLSDGALCGTLLSLTSGSFSTVFGLLLSRSIHQLTGSFQRLGRAAVLFPFAISPAVVAVCLFDLTVRMGWAGTFTGVLACQTIFGSAAAAVILLDGWGETERRRELLVRMLGGGTFDVWRHAIWPHARGLLGMCFLQSALFSWLDYGIVLYIGGGRVPTLTLRLFTLIRESSVNHAALATLLLLTPALFAVAILLLKPSLRIQTKAVSMEQQK